MTSHRLQRPERRARRAERTRDRARRSARTRALFSLGLVAVLSAGLSVKGTFAFWTDQATLQTGSITSGTLDITLDGNLAGSTNTGGTYTNTTFKLDQMAPGESTAYSFPVKNIGTVGLTYNLTATATGGLATTNGLQYSVTYGANATNTGTQANNNRAGACGAAATDANTTAVGSTAVSFGSNRALGAGVSETVCIVARLSSAAPNALQGLTGTASFLFDAKQVGS